MENVWNKGKYKGFIIKQRVHLDWINRYVDNSLIDEKYVCTIIQPVKSRTFQKVYWGNT